MTQLSRGNFTTLSIHPSDDSKIVSIQPVYPGKNIHNVTCESHLTRTLNRSWVVGELSYLPQDEWLVMMRSVIKLVLSFASLEQEQMRTTALQGWHPVKTK